MKTPQFDRMISDLNTARERWYNGNHESAKQLLKVVGSIALAESAEPDPNAPVPEAACQQKAPDQKA